VNGFAAQTFHAFCDGYANTLIVIKSANGNVFGAYTSAAGLWSSTSGYSADSGAFIYSLINSYNTPLIMKAISAATNSVRNIANKGPSFGLSAVDLSISDYSNLNNLSTAALSNTFKHPSLTGTQAASFLAGSANFSVLDIEVYHVITSISKILSEANENALISGGLFTGLPYKNDIELLYRASDNGYLAAKFHQNCDGLPYTLTVATDTTGQIFGGLAATYWHSPTKATAANDPLARLFKIISGDAVFMLTTDATKSITNDPASGPNFGAGPDLKITDLAYTASGSSKSFAKLCTTYKYTSCVAGTTATSWMTGLASFNLAEWEVFKIRESIILNVFNMDNLITLLPNLFQKQLILKYRASVDGFSAAAFHQKVNGQINVLSVIQTTSGNIFGGFNALPFNSIGAAVTDPSCYIYSLVNTDNNLLKLAPVLTTNAKFYDNASFGPSYGIDDLKIADNSNLNTNSSSNLGSTFPHPTYAAGSAQAKAFLAGANQFQTREIEVFQVV